MTESKRAKGPARHLAEAAALSLVVVPVLALWDDMSLVAGAVMYAFFVVGLWLRFMWWDVRRGDD